MTIYHDNGSVSHADPEMTAVLKAHQWNHKSRKCACNWTQHSYGYYNHPAHVAEILNRTDTLTSTTNED